jgi:sec-independent protein translocase protein TatA
MLSNLFDSPWKILIVAIVLIVLFGSKKLPHAARSLGQSMRILKKEVQGLHEDQSGAGAGGPSGAAGASDAIPPTMAIAAHQQPAQQRGVVPPLSFAHQVAGGRRDAGRPRPRGGQNRGGRSDTDQDGKDGQTAKDAAPG